MSKFSDLYETLSELIPSAIYVWGGRGEIVPDDDAERAAFFARKETSDGDHTKAENIARCERLYQRRKSAGISVVRAFDCSGLIYYGLHVLKLLNTRMSSSGYYSYCKENTDKTGMSRKDLIPGDLVFKHNGIKIVHVSLYIGDSRIIECAGRDIGVQTRRLTSADNRYGRLVCMKEKEPAPAPTPAPEPTYGQVRVKGGSVYIRSVNHKTEDRSTIIKTAYRGQKYGLILIDPDTGWYKIDLGDGRTGYISNRADLTEVIPNA